GSHVSACEPGRTHARLPGKAVRPRRCAAATAVSVPAGAAGRVYAADGLPGRGGGTQALDGGLAARERRPRRLPIPLLGGGRRTNGKARAPSPPGRVRYRCALPFRPRFFVAKVSGVVLASFWRRGRSARFAPNHSAISGASRAAAFPLPRAASRRRATSGDRAFIRG